ncbi:MAG: TolC family protein, partial [Bacteroidia bacterium]|nr:TolC family protein [Bacteroidia bacterium]
SEGKLKTARSQFLPELQFGYQNMSIRGMGADDIYYAKSSRFQAVQVGIGVPLFFGSNQSKSKALTYELKARELEYEYTKKLMNRQLRDWQAQLKSLEELCVYYENAALPNSIKARNAAWQQYQQGNLNFMEWTLLHNQAMQTQNMYLDLVQQYNQLFIQYQSFQNTNKN